MLALINSPNGLILRFTNILRVLFYSVLECSVISVDCYCKIFLFSYGSNSRIIQHCGTIHIGAKGLK